MKRMALSTLALIAAVGAGLAAFPLSAASAEEGWTIQRDARVDGHQENAQNLHLRVLSGSGDSFVLTYDATPGLQHWSSRLRGTVRRGRGQTMLELVQTNDRDYIAVHIGRLSADGSYAGTWMDNEGQQGEFKLLPGRQGEPYIPLER